MDRQRSTRHPPTDGCKAGATSRPWGVWGPGGHSKPQSISESQLSQGKQPGCIRPIWGCRSRAQAGEQFWGFWEIGGGCAKEDGGAVESSRSRTAGKAGGQCSVSWKRQRVLWSKSPMLPSFGGTRMLCQGPGAALAQPSQSQEPQFLQSEISVVGKSSGAPIPEQPLGASKPRP